MRLPIRGIQIVLIGAFFVALLSEFMSLSAAFEQAAYFGYERSEWLSFWARFLKETAYATFFLGEAALIEILYRIWLTLKAKFKA